MILLLVVSLYSPKLLGRLRNSIRNQHRKIGRVFQEKDRHRSRVKKSMSKTRRKTITS